MSRGRVALDESTEARVEAEADPIPGEGMVALGAAAAPARGPRMTVIRPAPRWPHLDVSELWHFREVLGMLTWRELKVRYKQTVVGVAWAIVQPVMTMVVFTFIFGRIGGLPSQGLPYPVFVYVGLLPWLYFASSLSLSSASVVGNVNLVTKVYFPRVLLPLSAIVVPVVDFALSFTILIGLMIWFNVSLGAGFVAAVPFLLLAALCALGVGLFFSALNVRYRDVPYAIPFIIQLWLYASPVIYPITWMPERWQWLLSLNPMTAVITGFRWAITGTPPPTPGQLLLGVAATLVFFVVGLAFFRSSEPRFADRI